MKVEVNSKPVQVLNNALKLMEDRGKVLREEAAPKCEFAQEIKVFTLQTSFSGDAENHIFITRSPMANRWSSLMQSID